MPLGLGVVDKAANAAQAWQMILETPYTGVVMGWALREGSGLSLLNRIRRHPVHEFTPILIVSQKLVPADYCLLDELPCTTHLPDTVTLEVLRDTFLALAAKSNWYRRHSSLIDGVMELAEEDGEKAVSMLRGPLASGPDPVPLGIVVARRLVAHGFARNAEGILRNLLQHNSQCVIALYELGKALYAQGQVAEAMVQFNAAHQLSPQNLGRLCLIGEIALGEGNREAAQKAFRDSLQIDPQDPLATLGAEAAAGTLRLRPTGADSVAISMAGILNGRGVALVRAGKFNEGIASYHAALGVLQRQDMMARVAFNVGLAFLRWQKLAKSLTWFDQASEWSGGTFAKAVRFAAKVRLLEPTADFPATFSPPLVTPELPVARVEVAPAAIVDIDDDEEMLYERIA